MNDFAVVLQILKDGEKHNILRCNSGGNTITFQIFDSSGESTMQEIKELCNDSPELSFEYGNSRCYGVVKKLDSLYRSDSRENMKVLKRPKIDASGPTLYSKTCQKLGDIIIKRAKDVDNKIEALISDIKKFENLADKALADDEIYTSKEHFHAQQVGDSIREIGSTYEILEKSTRFRL